MKKFYLYLIGVWIWIYTHAWWIALIISGLMFIVLGIAYGLTNSILVKVFIAVDFTVFAISIGKIIDEQFPI